MKRKTKEKKDEMSFFERRKKTFNVESGNLHEIFVDVSENQMVTDKTEQGIRVLVARYPDFYKIYFFKYIFPGEQSFPKGGIKVWNDTYGQMQYFYYESVALHPDGGRHKFYREEEL